MKNKSSITLVGLTVVLLFAAAAHAPSAAASTPAEAHEPPLVTVTGEAEVLVVPDEVILTLGVETWDKDLATAKRQNDAIVARVLGLAEEMGIPSRYVQTDYMNIEPRYSDGYTKRDFYGYFVRKTIVITLKEITAFEDLLSQALDAGVTYVHGIEFRTTELRKHRDQARALAVRAAREKAAALAGELGQEIGKPYRITEEYSGWWSWYSRWWGPAWGQGMTQNVIQEGGGGGAPVEGTVAPGQISVTARVSVSFELR